MKITYAAMPTGDPARSVDDDVGGGGSSAIRRTVKIALKNLKTWCARLRRGTTPRVIEDNPTDRPNEAEVFRDERTRMTMIVDSEESRNRANENLENELREESLLANDDRSIGDARDVGRTIDEGTTRERRRTACSKICHRSGEVNAGSLRGV